MYSTELSVFLVLNQRNKKVLVGLKGLVGGGGGEGTEGVFIILSHGQLHFQSSLKSNPLNFSSL